MVVLGILRSLFVAVPDHSIDLLPPHDVITQRLSVDIRQVPCWLVVMPKVVPGVSLEEGACSTHTYNFALSPAHRHYTPSYTRIARSYARHRCGCNAACGMCTFPHAVKSKDLRFDTCLNTLSSVYLGRALIQPISPITIIDGPAAIHQPLIPTSSPTT